jgi:hypothetical protein
MTKLVSTSGKFYLNDQNQPYLINETTSFNKSQIIFTTTRFVKTKLEKPIICFIYEVNSRQVVSAFWSKRTTTTTIMRYEQNKSIQSIEEENWNQRTLEDFTLAS